MDTTKKYVSLSRKNLDRCWEWESEHKGHPLSDAYMRACGAVLLERDETKIRHAIPGGKDSSNWPRWHKAYETVADAASLGFQYRDSLGRMILSLEKTKVLAGESQ